ncbi:uncharacterized protein LOC124147605 isoform X1 [Haliotis rufescens]|uniref:uncharacterized protein LOC124147605 isoform X1 n=1 Tax=Haliotis rufescens TaxID=6454 RepID=UPI00201EDF46|nr:uncharacterized protein LOC124147605 isoform X1 [Haliotis rufescens]
MCVQVAVKVQAWYSNSCQFNMAVVRLLRVVVLAGWMQLLLGSCPAGQFGDSCSYSCNCGTSCNATTGACSDDCDTGWRKAGGLCQKQNIALNKSASTTSRSYGSWYPSKAVDGDSDITGESRTCFHAAGSPSDWTVDLGWDYQLYDIRIYSRRNFYFRNANSNIYLNNDSSAVCSTLPSPSTNPNPTDLTCNGTGRNVTIRNPRTGPGDSDALNICEVEIYVCSPGIYGVNCNTSCHCLDSTCDRWTGFCPGDCRPGWQGQRCDTACNYTSYGTNCNKSCAERKCEATNPSCDHHTGACDTGCLPGWIDEDCTQECTNGTYGANCTSLCSDRRCAGNSSCNHVTGSCDLECGDGWMGVDCKTEQDLTQVPSQQFEATSFPYPAVVGAVVSMVVILVVVLAVILIRRRRGTRKGRLTHQQVIADKSKPTQVEDIGMYMNVGFDEDEKPALSSKNTSAKQTTVRSQDKPQGDFAVDDVYTMVIKDTGKNEIDHHDLERVEEEEDYDVSAHAVQVEDTPDRNYYNLDDAGLGHVIPVSEFQTRVEEMTPARAEEEFRRLPNGFTHSYDESQQPRNKGKNRFRGYYPYNYNRVVLCDVSDDRDNDYINASYVSGYKAEKRYIAAQGPYRPEVVEDFWRMIYQEECTTVVMVTELVEAGKMKCLQYWPEQGTLTYGDISVTKETETQLANYTVTELSVYNEKEGKIHHVHHFYFTSWPDHGVPDTSALLEFMSRVKVTTRRQTQPIIVHCSAGVGRTGTYIAIESLVDQAAVECSVDVVSFVSNMRGQRKNMIQTKEQYLFLYQAVAVAVSEGDTSFDSAVILQIDLSHVSAVTMGNKSVQEHLEALENESERGLTGDPITIVASYTSRKGFFLVTSHPDKEEVWNQVYTSDSRTLITWASDQLIHLPSTDSTVSSSRLTASIHTSEVISNDVILNTIDLTVNDDVSTPIQHYHLTGSARDPSVTLLVDSLLTWTSDPQRGSCTLVSESVSEARLLVLLVNIASRLKDDGRVDVISNLRRLQSSLGGPPFSQDDVRLCLEFAQGRLESLGLYANM